MNEKVEIQLPEGWRWTPLKYISDARVTNGVGLAAEYQREDWPRYIRTTDIVDQRTLRETPRYAQSPELLDEASVHEGDILLTNAGMTIGKSYLHFSSEPAVYAGYLTRVRPDNSVADPRFIGYYCLSAHYWADINRGATRSTIDNFSSGKYQNLRVPLPSLAVQRRIADFLDFETARIDGLITKHHRLQGLTEEQRRANIARAVTLGLEGVEPKESGLVWAPDIAAHYKVGPYSLYAKTGSGHTPSRSNTEYWDETEIPWVTTGDVARLRDGRREYLNATKRHISELGLANSAATLHPAGTVFLSRTASVGFSAIMGCPMATSQDFFSWTCDGRLSPEYLLWSLRVMGWRGEFDRLAYGSTHQTIYVPDLMALRGPVPPREEQEQIVAYIRDQIEPLHDLVDTVDEEVELLRERRQAIITEAVTGQLDIEKDAA